MTPLKGRAGLVTGAGSGIGRASALALAAAGGAVAVLDVDADGAKQTCELIAEAGGQAFAATCDVADDEAVREAVDRTVREFGRLDFAHNNAGILGVQSKLVDLEPADWDRLIGVNLRGVYSCVRHELRHMLEAGRGSIINTGSEASLKGGASTALYTASKHGVLGLSKTVALEVARTGIRVNTVCPGAIETGITASIAETNPALYERGRKTMPIGRYGRPEEIAEVVLFLASDASSLVTGHALAADGGWAVA